MVAPIDAAADPSMVETLAFNLKLLAKARDVGTLRDDPAQYGLAPPARTVRLYRDRRRRRRSRRSRSGRSPTRSVTSGPTGPRGSRSSTRRRWPRRAAGGPLAGPVALMRLLDLPGRVARRPSGPAGTSGSSARATSGGSLAPFRALADVEPGRGLLAEVTALRVADGEAGFVADDVKDLAPYGLDTPRLSITVQPRGRGRGRADDPPRQARAPGRAGAAILRPSGRPG